MTEISYNDYIKKILSAQVYDVAIESPLDTASHLSLKLGNTIWLKREDLQPVFSFKLRGAYNKMRQLAPEVLQRGVITAPAGNHAQGVALAARRLQTQATIVMPKTTPEIKVSAVKARGGHAILVGDNYDAASAYAKQLAEEQGLTFIPPYDDPEVIAGQGTIALELLRQHSQLDAVFIPVGGGGLLAGMAMYIKYLHPEIKVIAVEPEDAASFAAAREAQSRVCLPQVGIFADGVAVKQIGAEPFRVAMDCVDDVVTVTTDEICAAIKDIFDDTRAIAEPAGAVALAGLKRYVDQQGCRDLELAAIVSGANINFDRLRHVAERAEIGEQREALLAVEIQEQPGRFRQLCQHLSARSVTELNYRYAGPDRAHIFVGIEIQDEADRVQLIQQLNDHGHQTTDLTHNEMAKVHTRYMVGGRHAALQHEHVLRFEFPERPGALLEFLDALARVGKQEWNISLFHYRNHGAAYGRVLVGIQIPENSAQHIETFLQDLGYPAWDETQNPAYQLFLS